MSNTSEKKDIIIEYMLDKIGESEDVIQKTVDNFAIPSTMVNQYLQELIDLKIIRMVNINRYELVKEIYFFNYKNVTLAEDLIYTKDILPILEKINIPDNVEKIWCYAFTEMFNNAIDHSESKKILVLVQVSYTDIEVIIRDEGVGIFNKIKKYYNYKTVDDAISELFKGKLTTDSENHTGEGIFFTSRIMDFFYVASNRKIFSHNNYVERFGTLNANNKEDNLLVRLMKDKGTVIYMSISNKSHKELIEVFDEYSDVDGGFNKTKISLKNVFGDFPVSRSQAKRLYNRLDQFSQVELDFAGVKEIGQGFADELFVKFENTHPEIYIVVTNANEKVRDMIMHVRRTL